MKHIDNLPIEHRKARLATYIHKLTGGISEELMQAIITYQWEPTYFEKQLFPGLSPEPVPLLEEKWDIERIYAAPLFQDYATLKVRRAEPLLKTDSLYFEAGRWIIPQQGASFGLDLSLVVRDYEGEAMFNNLNPPKWNQNQLNIVLIKRYIQSYTQPLQVYRFIKIWVPSKPLTFPTKKGALTCAN